MSKKKFPKSVRTALTEGCLLPASVIDAKHPKAVRKQVKAAVAEKAAKAAPRTGPYAYGDDPRFGGTAVSAIVKLMAEASEVNQREAAEARQQREEKMAEKALWPNRYGDIQVGAEKVTYAHPFINPYGRA